jgi:hypothetical protein
MVLHRDSHISITLAPLNIYSSDPREDQSRMNPETWSFCDLDLETNIPALNAGAPSLSSGFAGMTSPGFHPNLEAMPNHMLLQITMNLHFDPLTTTLGSVEHRNPYRRSYSVMFHKSRFAEPIFPQRIGECHVDRRRRSECRNLSNNQPVTLSHFDLIGENVFVVSISNFRDSRRNSVHDFYTTSPRVGP